MHNEAFNTDTYEDQLALVLLEVFLKKDALAKKTYSTVKRKINETEECERDTRDASSFSPIYPKLQR